MPVTSNSPAPYAPAKTVLDIIKRHRERGLPPPINGDTLGRAGVPDSLHPRVIQTLQTLDLINDQGQPTATFEAIRLAPQAEYQKRLEEWLKGTYADVFSFVDPTTDDEIRIRDAFRSYQPVGQQTRMVTLFQGLCIEAGLMKDKPKSAPSPRPPSQRPRPAATPSQPSKRPSSSTKPTGGLPPALSGLMESLPSADEGWSMTERDKFLTTFKAVLDFCIPITKEKKETAAA